MANHELDLELHELDIKSGPNYDAWRITPMLSFEDKEWTDAARHVAEFGLLAPSAHNKQGWQLALSETDRSLTVMPDVTHIGTPSDKKGRETYIGVGCFVENVSQTLQAYGLTENSSSTEFTSEDATHTGIRFDMSNLQQGRLMHPDILDTIRKRRVHRGMHDEKYVIEPEFLDSLRSHVESENLSIKFITDQITKNTMGELQAFADKVVVMIPDFRYELGHHLVPNDTADRRVMPGDTFGMSDESSRKIHEALLDTTKPFDGDYAAGFARNDGDSIKKTSAIGVISVSHDEPQHWINAGRAFERIWLQAQQEGLDVGVMAAMVESPAHNKMLMARLKQLKQRPVVVFRMGKGLEKRPHSPRVTLDEIISNQE